jgi:RsmE family RNA methyltransferase
MITNAAKVERCYFDTHVLAPEYVRERLLDGLAQARDTRVPEVTVHASFRRLVEDVLRPGDYAARIVADESALRDRITVGAVCAGIGASDRVLVAIGPEGGWVDFERALLQKVGFRAVTLGSRILRSDVACLVALGLAHDALDLL